MRWAETGFILGKKRHGETSALVQGWTREHGRIAGLVHRGFSRRLREVLQAGNRVLFTWNARLEEQLGVLTIEPVGRMHTAELVNDRLVLAGISVINELIRLIPERDAHPLLFDRYERVWRSMLTSSVWLVDIVRFELAILREMGYGLDLSSCVATGEKDDLVYVSPRSGCAVSRSAGAPYHARLLPLPFFLLDETSTTSDPVLLSQGFRLTSFFLYQNIYHPHGLSPPHMREVLTRGLPSL